jgi:hypothetical protein
MDIVVCSEVDRINFIYNAGYDNDYEKYTEFIEGRLYASPVLYQTKDTVLKVIVVNNKGQVYLIDGKIRKKKVIDIAKIGKTHSITAAPAVGDINGDGIPDVAVQTNFRNIFLQ